MNQASLLLLLWDALQQRETTFRQVLDPVRRLRPGRSTSSGRPLPGRS